MLWQTVSACPTKYPCLSCKSVWDFFKVPKGLLSLKHGEMFPKVTVPASSILGAARSRQCNCIDFCGLLFPFPHLHSPAVELVFLTNLLVFLGLVFQDLKASSSSCHALSRSQLLLACTEHPPTPGAITGTKFGSASWRINLNAPG